jgi:hypothetical protein
VRSTKDYRAFFRPERKFIGRAKQKIAFISDPDGNSIELMEIPPESEIYRTYP